MRISDWSSDVCSSDLSALSRSRTSPPGGAGRPEGGSDRPRDRRDRPSTATASVRAAGRTLDHESRTSLGFLGVIYDPHLAIRTISRTVELVRATCRASAGQAVYISVVAITSDKQNK